MLLLIQLRYKNDHECNIPQFLYDILKNYVVHTINVNPTLKHHWLITLLCRELFLNKPNGEAKWQHLLNPLATISYAPSLNTELATKIQVTLNCTYVPNFITGPSTGRIPPPTSNELSSDSLVVPYTQINKIIYLKINIEKPFRIQYIPFQLCHSSHRHCSRSNNILSRGEAWPSYVAVREASPLSVAVIESNISKTININLEQEDILPTTNNNNLELPHSFDLGESTTDE